MFCFIYTHIYYIYVLYVYACMIHTLVIPDLPDPSSDSQHRLKTQHLRPSRRLQERL